VNLSEAGWSAEFDASAKNGAGVRVSAGKVDLPDRWEPSSTERFALGAIWRAKVWRGLYLEPRAELAYYPQLGTPYELEAGLRLGYEYKNFSVHIGVRRPLGNGNNHEDEGEYTHIPSGWKPEVGLNFTWRW
jgi:hypothetical protein